MAANARAQTLFGRFKGKCPLVAAIVPCVWPSVYLDTLICEVRIHFLVEPSRASGEVIYPRDLPGGDRCEVISKMTLCVVTKPSIWSTGRDGELTVLQF